MKRGNKTFSVGILAIIITVLFISGFIQVNLMYNGSTSGSKTTNPTIGNADTQMEFIYGDPTELSAQKTETVSIDLWPNGTVKAQRVTVNFVFKNEAFDNVSFDLIDRAEYCDLDTIKFQKGTFNSPLPYEVINTDDDFGVVILKWSNISLSGRSQAEFGYSIASYNTLPIHVETEYWVNGSQIIITPDRMELNTSVGSFVSNIIRIHNIQQPLFSSYQSSKPQTLALITLLLPFEQDEKNRDIAEPIYSQAPILSTELGPIQQVSWIAIGDEYELNWSTTVLKGGGWGIIELQPIRIDLIQSVSLTNVLFDGLSGLIGLIAAQQVYWAYLTLMAMIEELMGMVGIFELLLNDLQTMMGMLSMVNYSLINCLLITLVELDMTHSSIATIYNELSDMYYSDITNAFIDPLHPVRVEFRRILGLGAEGLSSNGAIGLGIPYMSLPLILDYYEDIERRITASFGAQLVELLGSPAIINYTSTEDNFRMLINATATQLSDNSTDFYTLIDIENLSLPIALGYSLNLTQRYEFELNVPLDRLIFEYIDAYFGEPIIPFDMFPSIPGSPESNIPGFYTWVLDLLRVGKSALWTTIGNLTRSLATLMLLLDSSFSQETLTLLDTVLSGSGVVNSSTPITLETGFSGISDLLNMFSGFGDQFNSPFGNPFGDLLPDLSTMELPIQGEEMNLLEQFGFYTALQIYMEPVPRIRQLLNITLPLSFEDLVSESNESSGMAGIGGLGNVKSAENGLMSAWDWNYTGLSSVTLTQPNLIQGSMPYKRIQFTATGDIDNGKINLSRSFGYTIPATKLLYSIRTSNSLPTVELVVRSLNATGHTVYAIQEHALSDLGVGTWHNLSSDFRSIEYWEYYDPSFDMQQIQGVELRITPHTTSQVNFDINYINFSREEIPYPYDLTILDGYLIGEGVEIFPNITETRKWISGLYFNVIDFADMNGDSISDIIAGSNEGYIYVLNGLNGEQLWNYSVESSVINLLLEDINGDSTPEIIFGTVKGNIYVINNSKSLLWSFPTWLRLDKLLFGNLTGTSNHQLVLVSDNNLIAYDHTGTALWNRTVKGTIRDIRVADLNGDGIDEISLTTSKYRVYTLNGTDGAIIWTHITEDLPTFLTIGNFQGDANQEIIYSTEEDYCVILDGIQGTTLLNFTTDSIVRGLYRANLLNNSYDDLLIHTGLAAGQNVSAFSGNEFNLLWNFTTPYGFTAIKTADYLPSNYDEVILSSIDNRLYVVDSNGLLQRNISISRSVNLISLHELTGAGPQELVFGLSNNHISVLDGDTLNQLWLSEQGTTIVTFQFIRTNSSIQLLYNLQDPITSMLDGFGFSLSGVNDLSTFASFDLTMGLNSLGGDSGLGGIGGLDLSTLNLTSTDLPLTGLGLMNMLQMELTLIATLQDMKLLSSSQRAYTGLHEVRYVTKDTINYQLYPILSEDNDAKYVQYKIRNYEELPITAHRFALNMTVNGQPIPVDRISLETWNGTHYVNLANNPIRNVTMEELGITFFDGKLIFKPFIDLEELEKAFITVDWLGRELRVKINTTGMNPNDLLIEPWVDLSIQMPGIEIPGVTSLISYSKTHPTFLVTAVPIPDLPTRPEAENFLLLTLKNPAFWIFLGVGAVSFATFDYMARREKREEKNLAAKKLTKWLRAREPSWLTLVKADLMTVTQYKTLKRIRYRLHQENLRVDPLRESVNKIFKWNLIGHFISTVFLMRFWRGINKPSRLIWILNTLEAMVLSPFKHAWVTFKNALGYLNPWDMDRARKRELLKKAANKRYWKKIEPPRRPIRKKRVQIIRSKIEVTPSKNAEYTELPKKIKDWDAEFRADGGTLVKKISSAKKLPPITSRDGLIFYNLSQRKFVGMTLQELAKKVNLPEFEVLVSLVRLFEKGLILLLHEGKHLSDDLWDIGSSLRKQDPELEKLIDFAESIETEVEEGIDFLKTEIKNEKAGTP